MSGRSSGQYERLRQTLCPGCRMRAICPQWEEQLDACADAAPLFMEPEELLTLELDGEAERGEGP